MAETMSLEGVYVATNQAVAQMEATVKKLNRQIQESQAALESLNAEKEQAMTTLQEAQAKTAMLDADLKTAWDTFHAKCQETQTVFDGHVRDLEQRLQALKSQQAELSTKQDVVTQGEGLLKEHRHQLRESLTQWQQQGIELIQHALNALTD